jgi:hypothetical protein
MGLLKLHRRLFHFLPVAGIIILLSFSTDRSGTDDPDNTGNLISLPPEYLGVIDYSKTPVSVEKDILTIPLKNAGRLFLIEAIIDNQPGNLIFDSGAAGLVMNRVYFRKYVKIDDQTSHGINGPVGDVEKISIGKINFSGLSLINIPAALVDLGHIENRRGVKVLGLIGFEFFKDFEIVIDAANNFLQLHMIDKNGNRINTASGKFTPDLSQPVEIVKNVLFINGKIGGKTLRFCLDTGAETNAISSHAQKSVLNTISIVRKSNLTGAGKNAVEVLFGTMNDFAFGGHQLKNMETIVTHLDALNEAYGIQIDGMLGYNFLIQGVICINFTKKELGMKFIKQN